MLSKSVVSAILSPSHCFIAMFSAIRMESPETRMSRELNLKALREEMSNLCKMKKLSKLVQRESRVEQMLLYSSRGDRLHVDFSLMKGRIAPTFQ